MSGPGRSPLARQLSDAQQEYIKRLIRELLIEYFPSGMVSQRRGGTGNQSGQATPGGPAGGALTDTYPDPTLSAAGLEQVDDRVAALLVAGTNVALTYSDVANTLTIAATGGGGGGGVPEPFVYLTDADGAYLLDADGAYLWEPE